MIKEPDMFCKRCNGIHHPPVCELINRRKASTALSMIEVTIKGKKQLV